MIAVETTSRPLGTQTHPTNRRVFSPTDSEFLNKYQMEILLFDTNPIRRKDWFKQCQKCAVSLSCCDTIDESVTLPSEAVRILVFDKSVVEDTLQIGPKLISQMPFNIVAFSMPQCSVSVATRLMKAGARWVFDNELEQVEFEAGFTALMRDANELNDQLKQFRRTQSLRSEISPGERAVLELVIKGVPNKTIAAQLDISTRTVEARRARVYRKCGVQSITELVRFFDRAEALKRQFSS